MQGLGPACGGKSLRRGVTPEEQRIILDVHNKYLWVCTVEQSETFVLGSEPRLREEKRDEADLDLSLEPPT